MTAEQEAAQHGDERDEQHQAHHLRLRQAWHGGRVSREATVGAESRDDRAGW